ncbi:hypothetical protein JA1_002056 [Spathaspora sp. JA1]|nr:hypothetical protein JA1_002056 [Spathaspora sp. JA1]
MKISSPLSELLPRDDNGCVKCPTTIGDCPACPSGQQCQLKSATCSQCAKYYCEVIQTSTSGKTSIGGIVGGVIGAVILLGILGGLTYYYYFIYQKKKRLMLDEDIDLIDDDMISQEFSESLKFEGDQPLQRGPSLNRGSVTSNKTPAVLNGGVTALGSLDAPVRPRKQTSKRLSTYESFTKPTAVKSKTRQQQQIEARQRRLRQQQIVQQANSQLQKQQQQQDNGIYIDLASSNRNSIATTISTTNASNILPIAYIPGVTVRPTKNNTQSIYSYETDSIFSDLNTIENASIIGDVIHANKNTNTPLTYEQQQRVAGNPTMTAIKAQPRLVNVDMIEEKDEDVTDDEQDSIQDEGPSHFNVSDNRFIIEEEDDRSEGDSDVDSDIIEINRATSVKTEKGPVVMKSITDNGILIDLATDNGTTTSIPLHYLDDDGKDVGSTVGSFVLDVKFDESSVPRSPFDDPI